MKKLRDAFIGLFFIIGILGACATTQPVKPFNGSGIPETTCAEACQHADQELQCQNGGACMNVCQHVENPDYAKCIAAAADCPAVDLCGLQVP